MIIKLTAYEDGFKEKQDQPKVEIILHEPTLEEFREDLADFKEVVELELEDA